MYICIYVCVTLRNAIYIAGALCGACRRRTLAGRTLVWAMKTMKKEVGILLHYTSEMSSHQWSGRWSNNDPCCHSWGSHYAVHLSLRGRSRQLTRLRKFVQLEFQLLPLRHIPFFERCCGTKKEAWWAGPQMYYLMLVSACARGLSCAFVTLVLWWRRPYRLMYRRHPIFLSPSLLPLNWHISTSVFPFSLFVIHRCMSVEAMHL